MKFFRQFFDLLILFAIALVILFTFIEDLSAYLLWDWTLRRILLFIGFGFDLFFTMEFLFRYVTSLFKGDTGEYIFHKRGWVDFIASVPLLLLNSGPSVYFLYSGSVFVGGVGVLNILKVIKAVRVARILRMLRVLKIFRNIKSVDSQMTQRHLTRIVSTVVVSIIGIMFISSIFFSSNFLASAFDENQKNRPLEIITFISEYSKDDLSFIFQYAKLNKEILLIKIDGRTIFSRYTDRQYNLDFGPSDFSHLTYKNADVFFDLRYENSKEALGGMLLLITIIFAVIALTVFYTPHFAMTIADPIFVMLKGMRDKSYNLEVDIPDRYSKDDIFKFSRIYNDKFLTLKAREEDGDNGGDSLIKLDNMDDLFS